MGSNKSDTIDDESEDVLDDDADDTVEAIDGFLENMADLSQPAGLAGLRAWICETLGVTATWIDSFEVEVSEDEIAWAGEVEVFEIAPAQYVYAWSEQEPPSCRIRCFAVLQSDDITNAAKAVRAVLAARQRAH